MRRHGFFAIAATIVVVTVLVLGFRTANRPAEQRKARIDGMCVQEIYQISLRINAKWKASNNLLPSTLEAIPLRVNEFPAAGNSLVYKPQAGSQYELCATFLTDTAAKRGPGEREFWLHEAGQHCFAFDAAKPEGMSYPYEWQ